MSQENAGSSSTTAWHEPKPVFPHHIPLPDVLRWWRLNYCEAAREKREYTSVSCEYDYVGTRGCGPACATENAAAPTPGANPGSQDVNEIRDALENMWPTEKKEG